MSKPSKKIGIVEDDASMLRATEALLDAHGYTTVAFSSAEDFLARGIATRFDCLVLDIQLGGISGIELHDRLKALGGACPVIFVTALESEGAWQRALQSGCVACLRKPVPAGQLVQAIAKTESL